MKTLNEIAKDAISTVESGYYEKFPAEGREMIPRSLVRAIKKNRRAIICEIKFASPSAGKISHRNNEVSVIAKEMELGGAAGLSVLTEPRNFRGSISNLMTARNSTALPIIMKDIIVSSEQIRAARRIGASAILLIEELFSDGMAKDALSLDEAVRIAKKEQLEVVVESHTRAGFDAALNTGCDILGVNNRNLRNFDTDLHTSTTLLRGIKDIGNKLLMSESGFERPEDISWILKKLRAKGSICPDAFLIGTSIMRSRNIQDEIRQFLEAAST